MLHCGAVGLYGTVQELLGGANVNDPLTILLAIVALPTMVIAPVAWVCMLVFGFKAVRNARPDVNLWGRETMWNPGNVLIFRGMLTDEGKRYRRKCFLAVLWFVVPIGTAMLLATITGNLG